MIPNTSAQYWSCARKRRYTRTEARQAQRLVGAVRGIELRIYRCDYGHHWHLTHVKVAA